MGKRSVGGLVIALAAVAVFLLLRGESVAVSYWVIDDSTLGIQVIHGPRSSCTITEVDETTIEVRIQAECRTVFPSLGGTAAGYPYDFVVTLGAALGARAVVDGRGTPAVLCVAPRCGMGG